MRVCDEEETDMTTAEAIRNASNKTNPSARIHQMSKALQEVDLIEQGVLPRKSARSFLKDLREEK